MHGFMRGSSTGTPAVCSSPGGLISSPGTQSAGVGEIVALRGFWVAGCHAGREFDGGVCAGFGLGDLAISEAGPVLVALVSSGFLAALVAAVEGFGEETVSR